MTTKQSFYRNQEGKILVSTLVAFWIPFVCLLSLNLLLSYRYVRDGEYVGSILSIITGGFAVVMLIDLHGCFRHQYLNTVLELLWLANQIVSFGFWFQMNLPKEWQWKQGFNLGLSATLNMVFLLALDIHRNPDYYSQKMSFQVTDATTASPKSKLAFALRVVHNIGILGWYCGYSLQFALDQHFAAALLCICSAGFMLLRKMEKEGFIGSLGEQFNTNFNQMCSLNQLVALLFFQFLLPTALQSPYLHTVATCASVNVFLQLFWRLRTNPAINDARTSAPGQLHTEAPSSI